MTRRLLSDTLVELLEALQPADAATAGVRLSRVALDLPFEVRLAGTAERPELLADLPRWRWRTFFDDEPSRLAISVARDGGAL
jgi:hypothetical protein